MIQSQDIKKGVAVRMDGGIWVCIDFQHRKPGKGNTIMNVKLKNVTDGRVLERRFNIGERLEDVRIERRPYQYLYKEGDDYVFMNQETFDQAPIPADLVSGVEYMKESYIVEVVSDADTETVLYAEMPQYCGLSKELDEEGKAKWFPVSNSVFGDKVGFTAYELSKKKELESAKPTDMSKKESAPSESSESNEVAFDDLLD